MLAYRTNGAQAAHYSSKLLLQKIGKYVIAAFIIVRFDTDNS